MSKIFTFLHAIGVKLTAKLFRFLSVILPPASHLHVPAAQQQAGAMPDDIPPTVHTCRVDPCHSTPKLTPDR